MITCGVRLGPVDVNPAQLLIFYEACSESRYVLDLRGETLWDTNLKTEFQRFAEASWPPDPAVMISNMTSMRFGIWRLLTSYSLFIQFHTS